MKKVAINILSLIFKLTFLFEFWLFIICPIEGILSGRGILDILGESIGMEIFLPLFVPATLGMWLFRIIYIGAFLVKKIISRKSKL